MSHRSAVGRGRWLASWPVQVPDEERPSANHTRLLLAPALFCGRRRRPRRPARRGVGIDVIPGHDVVLVGRHEAVVGVLEDVPTDVSCCCYRCRMGESRSDDGVEQRDKRTYVCQEHGNTGVEPNVGNLYTSRRLQGDSAERSRRDGRTGACDGVRARMYRSCAVARNWHEAPPSLPSSRSEKVVSGEVAGRNTDTNGTAQQTAVQPCCYHSPNSSCSAQRLSRGRKVKPRTYVGAAKHHR